MIDFDYTMFYLANLTAVPLTESFMHEKVASKNLKPID